VGAVAYADDLVLLAPTASALRKMLAIYHVYAAEYSISFNAQKSKSNVCRYLRPLLQDRPNVFYIDGKPVDFVSKFIAVKVRLFVLSLQYSRITCITCIGQQSVLYLALLSCSLRTV